MKRVYNWRASEAKGPSVPFVELDTNTYQKKLWISEKKLLSPPIKSQYGQIWAVDSIVTVAFSVRDTGYWHAYWTYTTDYGATWSGPILIQPAGFGTSESPYPLIYQDQIFLGYHTAFLQQPYIQEMLLRTANLQQFELGDSILIDTTFSSSEALYSPKLLSWADTLFIAYAYYYGTSHARLQKSINLGESWVMVNPSATEIGGNPYFFLRTDTALSIVDRNGLEIGFSQSFDGGISFPIDMYISAVDQYASQIPAASTDGVSDIHVVWYDFDGAPPGWGGYVFYRRSLDNGQTWDQIKSLSLLPYAENVDIWGDTSRVYAVWNDSRFGSPDYAMYLRYSHDRGQSWSSEIMIVDSIDPAWEPDVYGWGDFFYFIWREQNAPEYIRGVYYRFGAWYLPGDVDYSGSVNVADITYLVNYLFRGGNEPFVPDVAQMNGQGGVNVVDVTYIVDYLFRNGPPPVGGEPGL
jgi:hypothetical protein